MKKLFWAFMYLLALILFALTIYLYVMPEREILLAGSGETESRTEWVDMPHIGLNDAEVDVGTTTLQTLADHGFQFRFESGGKRYPLEISEETAEARMQYKAVLFLGSVEVGSLTYVNLQERKCAAADCVIDALDLQLSDKAREAVRFRMNGVALNELTMDQVPDRFPDFTEIYEKEASYRKAVVSDCQSSVAYIRGDGVNSGKVRSFGVRNYIPKELRKENGNH
jgi:hypothetical protein